jgi:hypothetical protein
MATLSAGLQVALLGCDWEKNPFHERINSQALSKAHCLTDPYGGAIVAATGREYYVPNAPRTGGCMRVTMCAVLVAGALAAVAAQTPPTVTPPSAQQQPEDETVRGPRLGSPEIVMLGPDVPRPVSRKRSSRPTPPRS